MQGILYLDKVPKLAVEAPTPTAKTIENTKQKSILGSLKIILKGGANPLLKNKLIVRITKASASMADKIAAADLTSHGKGR